MPDDARYTKASFANMYKILKELDDMVLSTNLLFFFLSLVQEGINKLESDWKNMDPQEGKKGVGLSKEELANITEEFAHTIKVINSSDSLISMAGG